MPSDWVMISSSSSNTQSYYYDNRVTWIVNVDPFTVIGEEEEESKPKLGFFND